MSDTVDDYLDEVYDLVPDNYDKETTSNFMKLMAVLSGAFVEIGEALDLTLVYRDVDEATGYTLDLIGKNVNQQRGRLSDDIYRVVIKSAILRNQSGGGINDIIEITAKLLNVENNTISVEELYTDTTPEPAAIGITEVPLEALLETGMDITTFGKIVGTLVAAGVRLDTIDLSGTFVFGETLETESEYGFADLSQTTGGSLGGAFTPDDSPLFPI